MFLCCDKDVVVTAGHIDKVVGQLERDGKIGDDNRAGFPGQLHRVSVLRGREVKKLQPRSGLQPGAKHGYQG